MRIECTIERDNDGRRERVRARKKHSPKNESCGESRPYHGGGYWPYYSSLVYIHTARRCRLRHPISHHMEANTAKKNLKKKIKKYKSTGFSSSSFRFSFFFLEWTHDLRCAHSQALMNTQTDTHIHIMLVMPQHIQWGTEAQKHTATLVIVCMYGKCSSCIFRKLALIERKEK